MPDPDLRGTRRYPRWCYRPEVKVVEGPASDRFSELVTFGDGTEFLAQKQGGLRRTDLLRVPGATRQERKANLKKMR